jgi:hypothetical protein
MCRAVWLETASRIGSEQQYCKIILYPLYVSCLSAQCLTGRRLCVVGGWAVSGSACQVWLLYHGVPLRWGTVQSILCS